MGNSGNRLLLTRFPQLASVDCTEKSVLRENGVYLQEELLSSP